MATKKGSHRPPVEHQGDARRKPSPADAAERVVNKLDETISRKATHLDRKASHLDRKAAQLDRQAARLQDRKELIERIAGQIGALDVWTRAEPGGRRPRFTRDEIAHAAMHIADTEGFPAVSMRRVATEIGAGTMTLYHYVRTKDELLTLVKDTLMGEVVVPPEETLPAAWRDALTVIARRTREAILRHPWILDITDDTPFGPNSIRHFDQTLEAVAGLPVSIEEKLDIVGTVDDYVFGHCMQERNDFEGETLASDEVFAYCIELIASGDYPQLSRLVEEHGIEGTWARIGAHSRDPGRFDRNLTRILDGIEATLLH